VSAYKGQIYNEACTQLLQALYERYIKWMHNEDVCVHLHMVTHKSRDKCSVSVVWLAL